MRFSLRVGLRRRTSKKKDEGARGLRIGVSRERIGDSPL